MMNMIGKLLKYVGICVLIFGFFMWVLLASFMVGIKFICWLLLAIVVGLCLITF